MRLNFNDALLDKLSEGVILLDRLAQVVSHNQVAEPWVKQARAMTGVIKDLLDLEVRGRIKLPARLGMWTGKVETGMFTGEVWLILNGRRDYAIFIAPQFDGAGSKAKLIRGLNNKVASTESYIRLLGDEARAEISALCLLIGPHTAGQLVNATGINVQCARVDQLLRELKDLSLLMEQDSVFVDERLNLSDIVFAGLPAMPTQANANRPDFVLSQSDQELGAVYGQSAWLSYALRVLFDALQRSAPARSHITVTTRQIGNFVLITGRVAAGLAHVSKRAKPKVNDDGLPTGQTPIHHDDQVRWLLCRRIIALHAGHLKLAFLPEDASQADAIPGIDSFTLALATGQPTHERSRISCASCPQVLQAQAYAADLAQLLNQLQTF